MLVPLLDFFKGQLLVLVFIKRVIFLNGSLGIYCGFMGCMSGSEQHRNVLGVAWGILQS